MPFTSRPHVKLGVGFAFKAKVPKIDDSGTKVFVEVKSLPPSDEFSLSAQLKAGVNLKEVNSRLIGSSTLEVPNEKDSNSATSPTGFTETSEKVEVKPDSTSNNSNEKE